MKCDWNGEPEAYGSYTTQCGKDFVFNDDGAAENDFKFCPYCGKPINEVQPDDEGMLDDDGERRPS